MKRKNKNRLLAVFSIIVMLIAGCGADGENGAGGDSVEDGDLEMEEEYPWDDHSLIVMSFNVLCSFCDTSYDPWNDRISYFTDIFERHEPDLIGLQEFFTAEDVEQVLDLNPGFSALWYHDDEGAPFKDYPDSTIFYRTERFDVVENGFYWLSDTPDLPFSSGWADGNLYRLVAWAHLRQKSDDADLYFSSTHFDNNSPNQEMSAPIYLDRTGQWADEMPAIVVGDYNSKPGSVAYGILDEGVNGEGFSLTNIFDIADTWYVDSNLEPVPAYDASHRIDHIFVAGEAGWSSPRWVIDMNVYGSDDLYPSDHFAILAEIAF